MWWCHNVIERVATSTISLKKKRIRHARLEQKASLSFKSSIFFAYFCPNRTKAFQKYTWLKNDCAISLYLRMAYVFFFRKRKDLLLATHTVWQYWEIILWKYSKQAMWQAKGLCSFLAQERQVNLSASIKLVTDSEPWFDHSLNDAQCSSDFWKSSQQHY